jgi:D-alanine-D-alanine ligase
MSNNQFCTTFRIKSDVFFKSTTGTKHVVVLAGGMSAEREVSLNSSTQIISALIELGYKVTMVDMGSDLGNVLHQLKPDVVYNSLHGTYGEDGCVPGLLNIMRIPYTHPGVLGSSLAFNKAKTREIFMSNNIKCAPGMLLHRDEKIAVDPMPRPYVIKPISQGSSIGVHVIFEGDDFDFKDYRYDYGDQILVEKYIPSRELMVVVLNGIALKSILEVKVLERRFLDYDSKYVPGMALHILPANISEMTYLRAINTAETIGKLFHASKGVVRVDFVYSDAEDELYAMELNTHPGTTATSFVPDIVKHSGMSMKELVTEVIKSASYEE